MDLRLRLNPRNLYAESLTLDKIAPHGLQLAQISLKWIEVISAPSKYNVRKHM